MRSYLELIKIDLKLAGRNKSVLFFNYLFPLIFFFLFAEMLGFGKEGAISYVVSMVLVLGILGNGLFGAGFRAVQEREMNILRRFKVAPITPSPLLVASLITGLVVYIPAVVLILTIAHWKYGMDIPVRIFSLFTLIAVGVISFRSIGLIIASVANSTQEANILIQSLYMPMLFLSGASFPIHILPQWAQVFSQFLPASYLVTGFQGIFFRRESIFQNITAIIALLITLLLATFISNRLFRWEKDEKIKPAGKLWVLAVLLPFFLIGVYQLKSQEQLHKARALWRDVQRSEKLIVRGARVFVGDGRIIESATVIIEKGKIAEIVAGVADQKDGEVIEATGKTLLPGLIDVHVHLGSPGGFYDSSAAYDPEAMMERALKAYLYCGVTAVKSAGDSLDASIRLRNRVADGELLGSELFVSGPLFTAEGGHGAEYFANLTGFTKAAMEQQFLRMPKNEQQAHDQVRQLKRAGADGIKAVLEAGEAGRLFNRMDPGLFAAVAGEAHAQKLPIVVHTGDAQDIHDALASHVDGIEHGSFRELLPEDLFSRMASSGAFYDPTLSVIEALAQLAAGTEALLDRSLVRQVSARELIAGTRNRLKSKNDAKESARWNKVLEIAKQNLSRAYNAGAPLVTGSDAGNPLVFHGPTIQQELKLWIQAGVPSKVALQAATYNAAKLLRADKRMGLVQKGYEANLVLVDGDPVQDVTALERISLVIYKGERINRANLFQ